MDSLKQYRDAGSTPDQIINCLNQELLQLKSFKEKHDLEFSRYKQDCRKRALDLAHTERDRNYYGGGSTNLIPKQPTVSTEDTLKVADKYYKWLINLPQ